MRIKELTNAPQWLLDAVTENEDITIDQFGLVQWNSGNFLGGNFLGGDFWGGNFRGGDFWGGNFRGGNFRGGDFWGGNFRGGDFRGGNFRGGDFWGGNFRGGNFRGGDFWGEKIANRPLLLYGLLWDIWISDTRMKIGCQLHSHEEWATFNDEQISEMDSKALPFWNQNKIALLAMCNMHAEAAKAKT